MIKKFDQSNVVLFYLRACTLDIRSKFIKFKDVHIYLKYSFVPRRSSANCNDSKFISFESYLKK